jgi:tetratricopeptide (TPR) repeat protein
MILPQKPGSLLIGIIIVVAFSSCLSVARADEAKKLYKKAGVAFNNKEYIVAADLFRAAYEAKPSWKIFYNLGQAEAAAARYGLALEVFESYLVQGADEIREDRRNEVLQEVQRLRLMVGFLAIEGEDGLELIVDDFSRGVTPFASPVRIAVGKHNVEIRKGEEVIVSKTISMAGDVTATLTTESEETKTGEEEEEALDDTPQPEVAGALDGEDEKKWMLISGIAALGVGVVGIGVGAYFAYQGGQDYEQAQEYRGVDEDKFDEYNNEKVPLDKTMTIVGFVAGGVLAVAGATLIVIHQVKKKEETSDQAVVVTPNGISVRF